MLSEYPIAVCLDDAIMTLTPELQRTLIESLANCMIEHTDELVALEPD